MRRPRPARLPRIMTTRPYSTVSRIFWKIISHFLGKTSINTRFSEFLHNLFISHISEHFFSTFSKPVPKLFQIFSKFHQIFAQFLYTYTFSKVNQTFCSLFFCKKSIYFPWSFSTVTSKFIRKIHQVFIKIFLKLYEEFSRFF